MHKAQRQRQAATTTRPITAEFLDGRGQKMEVATSDGLHEVRLAAIPWIHPVVSVRHGMLAVATSRAALEQAHRVRRGDEPDIRSSERFARLGIGTGGQGAYLDCAQLDASLGGFIDLLGALGFFLSVLPDERDTRPLTRCGAVREHSD